VDFDEHRLLIKTAVHHAGGRVSIIAGTGANATSEAIELAEYAKEGRG
jgi:4-hydroxy-tetrahydrodipicolinate synthase